MAAFAQLLGADLLAAGMEKKPVADALSGKKAVALYFSAHWCPPCRGFTPKLAAWYKENLAAKGLEVVFVSSDKDESQFKEYFAEMPWLALPFSERAKKEALSKKFKVNGIPALVILDADGKTITTDGRSAVSQDPAGNDFPWIPVPPKTLLAKAKLIKNGGETVTIADAMKGKKALALYFSAHWCPPCRGFTPQLAEWYKKDLSSKGLEVVFVSSDKNEDQFKEYFAEQPWLALDFADRALKEKLSNAFGVSGIPSLVILDSELNTVTTEGRGAVSSDPTGMEMPWHPKPVHNLKAGPGDINESTTLILFCEHSEAAEKKTYEDMLTPIAEKYIKKAKETGDDAEFAFTIVTDSEGLAGRIRGMVGLEDAKEPRFVLMDIPDNGGYYVQSSGPVTAESVETFLAEYKNEELRRKQLE
eukprot:TRINITY_DN58_c0_g1_i1.p1 TRINITY_DN58_c0_g1~~TRINITY_DN58_c0_g1_i1.p1  ORF type:complete len:445 (-),score=138.89 TRINITY_DN58_c0_g1_i1:326-1579(-)